MNTSQIASVAVLILIIAGVVFYAFWINPSVPQAPVPVPIVHPFGIVTEKTSSQLTLKVEGGKTLVVKLTPETQFLFGTTTGTLSDVSVGSIVSVSESSGNQDGSITAQMVEILPPPPRPAPSPTQ